MSTDRILDVSELWAGYGATPILQGVSMSISRGEIVGVIGRNGVGKSTLMRCLIGLLDTWRGTITFMDQDVTQLQADALITLDPALARSAAGIVATAPIEALTTGRRAT